MLILHIHKPITDVNVAFIDDFYGLVSEPSWYNDLAIEAIETIDGNRYIGDGVSESEYLGIIAPSQLSGGVKTLIYAMNNPNTVCPIEWLGDNCSKMLNKMSKEYDLQFTMSGYLFKFEADQQIFSPDVNKTFVGLKDYLRGVMDTDTYKNDKHFVQFKFEDA